MKNQETLNKTLMLAVQMGNLKAVQQAVTDGADVNFKGADGQTPLLRSILFGKADVFHFLIEKGADVNVKDNEGKTPLMAAFQMGDVDFSDYLIEKGANQEARDIQGNQAKDYQLKEGVGLVEPVSTKEEDMNLNDLLIASIKAGDKQGIEHALALGADIEQTANGVDGTPLMVATLIGNVDVMSLLLEKGAKVNESIVKKAAEQGNFNGVMVLTKKGKEFFTPSVQMLLVSSSTDKTELKNELAGSIADAFVEEKMIVQEEKIKVQQKRDEEKEQAKAEEKEQAKAEDKSEEKTEDKKMAEKVDGLNEQTAVTQKLAQKYIEMIAKNTIIHMDHFVTNHPCLEQTNAHLPEAEQFKLSTGMAAELMRLASQKADIFNMDKEEFMNKTASVLLRLAAHEDRADVVKVVMSYTPNLLKNKQESKGTLQIAAKEGNLNVMNELLYHHADVNQTNFNDHDTPLYWAVHRNDAAMVKLLLSKGAKTGKGLYALVIDAATNGGDNVIDALLVREGKDKVALAYALDGATFNGHLNAVKKILNAADKLGVVAYNQVLKPIQTYKGAIANRALLKAIQRSNDEMLQLLLENGADIHSGPVMMIAARTRNYDMAKKLIEMGADVNEKGDIKKTGACFSLYNEVVEGNASPLDIAILANDAKMVQLLLENGAKMNAKTDLNNKFVDINKTEPIVLAASAESNDIVLLLLEKGARINATNKKGETVLDICLENAKNMTIGMDAKPSIYQEKYQKFIEVLKKQGAKTSAQIREERAKMSLFAKIKQSFINK